MENIVQNIIENLTNYDTNFLSSNTKNKEKPKDNMSIKTEEGKVNFVFDEDDEEDSDSNDIDNILSFEYTEDEENYFDISHVIYQKNTVVDIESLPAIPFTKIKKVSNFFSIFGKNNENIKHIKYLVMFDENFMYMIKMTLKENNQNNFYKRIGNHYDLYNFKSIKILDDEIIKGYKNIILTFINKKDDDLNINIKELHMDFINAAKFFKILKFYLEKINIPFNYHNDDFERIFGRNNRKVNSSLNGFDSSQNITKNEN